MAVPKPILLDFPVPILTPRLQIRPRHAGEGAVIAQAVRESREILLPWMPFAKAPPTDEAMEEHCRRALSEFIARTNFTMSIYDREGRRFLGSTGLHRPNWSVPSFHIGYWAHRETEGKGIVTEATNALTRYAFGQLGAKRIEIRCDSRNARSLAVMKRLGFVEEGLLKNDDVDTEGNLRDTIVTARYDTTGLPPLEVSW